MNIIICQWWGFTVEVKMTIDSLNLILFTGIHLGGNIAQLTSYDR